MEVNDIPLGELKDIKDKEVRNKENQQSYEDYNYEGYGISRFNPFPNHYYLTLKGIYNALYIKHITINVLCQLDSSEGNMRHVLCMMINGQKRKITNDVE